jgi:hypothetical protein
MDAYDIMRAWDAEAGIPQRSDEDLDRDVPGGLSSDYEDWKLRLEADDVDAIVEGRQAWGLPIIV